MSERLHSLFVDWQGDTLGFQYMCRTGNTVPPLTTFREPIQTSELRDISEAIARVLARQRGGTKEVVADEGELQEWGGRLYDKVIPSELADKLREERESAYLVLYLDPLIVWLPWELLWDGEQFLCRRFRIARLLQRTGIELRAAEGRLRQMRSGRGVLIVFGDTSGLDAETEKAEVERTLSTLYGTNVWFHRAKSAGDILEELKKDYEICHFVGHGRNVSETPGETGWRFADGTVLTCRDIESISSRAAFPLLIFANSCDSARQSFADAQGYVSTLYQAFLRQGAPHYIGTVAPVPDEPARDFAQSFYRLVAQGLSVGEALWETRRAFSERPGIPIWAYYLHYGDPTYRFSVESPATRALPSDSLAALAWRDVLEYDSTADRPEPELFVDREKELAEAKKRFKHLADGKPSVLFIAGEVGVGKSALLSQVLLEGVREVPGTATAIGTCNVQLGVSDPYFPFKAIFRSLVLDTTPLVQPHKEALTVGELVVAELVLAFPQLLAVLRPDASVGTHLWERICQRLKIREDKQSELPACVDQTVIFDQMSRMFRQAAKAAPLIIAVDNLHWADESSIALFLHLGCSLVDARVLLVGTYRSDLITTGRGGKEHAFRHSVNELRRYGAHTISLDLSTAKERDRERIQAFVRTYLDCVLPGHRLPRSFVRRLVDHTGGNPLFLKELVSYAQEKGHIISREGRWELPGEVEDFELPESVGAIIEERVAQLSGELRETLTYASVEGADFTAQVLANLQQLDEDKVLTRLVEDLNHSHQLVDERGEHELTPENVLSLFHFRNALTQQHIYQGLGVAQRRRLHKKVGECLEQLYGDKRTDIASHLATHFRIAREWNKALPYAIEAARQATKVYASSEAIRNYKTALELWELTQEKRVELKTALLLELGDTYKYVAMYDEAVAVYEQIVGMPEVDSSPFVRACALDGIGDVHRARGDYAEALEFYKKVEGIAKGTQDGTLLAEVRTDLADLFYRKWMDNRSKGLKEEASSSRAEAQKHADLVLKESEPLGMWENLRRANITLGNMLLKERRFTEAQQYYTKAAQLAEKHNLAMDSLNNLGELMRRQGRYAEALKYYGASLDWAVKTGAVRYELLASFNMGIAHLVQQDFERASDLFDKVLDLNKPMRHRISVVLSLAMKGLAFELQGALPAASELYREALKVVGEADPDTPLAEVYAKLGKMLFAYDEPEPAAYFLKKYLGYSPPDAPEIQDMVKTCSKGVGSLDPATSRDV
jgi:tetratricopeptide (TPR) repeat protein/CHAT domain-containing protein